jgi:hypothetical protein
MLLQAFYSIRSERLLMVASDHSVFSKKRDRLLEGDIAAKFLSTVLVQPRVKRLLSTEHFSVDGMLIEAWASMKNGVGRTAGRRCRAQSRSGFPLPQAIERDARLEHRSRGQALSKGQGKEAKLSFMGHGLMENRHSLLVDACLTLADGHAERVAALHMIEPRADRPRAITLSADKAYDAEDFRNELRTMKATPHVGQNTSGRHSGIDGSTTTWRLRRQPAHPQAHRGSLRLDQNPRRSGKDKVPTPRSCRMGLHLRSRRLQFRAVAEATGGDDMSAPVNCLLVGRSQITEADIWDRHYLDLCGRATMTVTEHGHCQIAFGALQAGLDMDHNDSSIDFTWRCFEERDETSEDGSAELLDDGSIEIARRRAGPLAPRCAVWRTIDFSGEASNRVRYKYD